MFYNEYVLFPKDIFGFNVTILKIKIQVFFVL